MKDTNLIVLTGNIATDLEITDLKANRVTHFKLAVNNGEHASFIPVECWNKLGETVVKHLKKGSRIHLEGRLKQESWKDKANKPQCRIKVTATTVQFLDKREVVA